MRVSTELQQATFDAPDQLNDDGSVTFRVIPSNWRCYNFSPDTYQLFTGDSWTSNTIEYFREEQGIDLTYDDFEWHYDHAGIVRGLAEALSEWFQEVLMEIGLESLSNVTVVETWSPQFYNFTTDGFELEITCDPTELRALTHDFDVDQWVREYYRSCDGFISYVPRRMEDPDWRAGYDGEFRIEHLFAERFGAGDPYEDSDPWKYHVWEQEDEVYEANTTVVQIGPEYMDSGYTLRQLEEWAAALTPRQEETLI